MRLQNDSRGVGISQVGRILMLAPLGAQVENVHFDTTRSSHKLSWALTIATAIRIN